MLPKLEPELSDCFSHILSNEISGLRIKDAPLKLFDNRSHGQTAMNKLRSITISNMKALYRCSHRLHSWICTTLSNRGIGIKNGSLAHDLVHTEFRPTFNQIVCSIYIKFSVVNHNENIFEKLKTTTTFQNFLMNYKNCLF